MSKSEVMHKILVADPLGQGGMAVLSKDKSVVVDERPGLKPEELKKIIAQYDAIIVRSGTRLTEDLIQAAQRLRVIGRAGSPGTAATVCASTSPSSSSIVRVAPRFPAAVSA